MIAQTGIDFVTPGQIDAADCRIATDLVIEIGHFPVVMFKSTHGVSIRQKES